MDNLSFVGGDIMSFAHENNLIFSINKDDGMFRWDRQTIVLLCDNDNILQKAMKHFSSIRKPQSELYETTYHIHGFVNLDYNINERDPAKRNVRLVYCDRNVITMEEIHRRFDSAYIIKVGERSEYEYAEYVRTQRIGKPIPQIPSR